MLSLEQIDSIYGKLKKYCLVDDNLKKAHVDEINSKKANKFQKI